MELLENAQRDSLTGCYTKEALFTFLDRSLAEYVAHGNKFSILLLDIDGFKTFNDKYGHVFGDEALKYFASSLRLNIDEDECIVFRFGGDEFVLVFPEKASKEAYRLGVSIEKSIKNRPFLFKGHEYKVSFSGGVASCPHDSTDTQDILEKADKAMYFSKRRSSGGIAQYCRVRPAFLRPLLKILLVVTVLMATMAIARHFLNIDMKTIWYRVNKVRQGIAMGLTSQPSRIYLKSGDIIEGAIIREDDNDVYVRIDMLAGEGSGIIKKSNIKYIENNDKR